MNTLWIDLETRSRCDLKVRGLYNYAADKSTSILIASYALNDGPIQRWQVNTRTGRPAKLLAMLRDKKTEVRAHNAAFERHLIKNCWGIDVPHHRWYCTSYQARSQALPAGLGNLGQALTAKAQKDWRGAELIRLLSVPQEDGHFNNDPDLLHEFGDYCDQDVNAMRSVSQTMRPLTDDERALWCANETVNDRGLPIDTDLCDLALKYAGQEHEEAEAEVARLTKGAIRRARGTGVTNWIYDHGGDDVKRMMRVHKAGVEKRSLDADIRSNILALTEENPDAVPALVIDVIAAVDAASSASVAKFSRMKDMTSADGRLRGAFVAAGASGTGRFSSKGAQLHNFPRTVAKDPEGVKALMRKGKDLPGPVLQVLKSMLRPAICPGYGRVVVRGDWNAVEARALPWLTGRAAAAVYLDAFKDKTRDVYVEQALAAGLGKERQPGKVVVLALGYGGAEGALAQMERGYGVFIQHKREVVARWRAANRWAPDWWYELDRAAVRAARLKAETFVYAGRVAFWHSGPASIPALLMGLPSGRVLTYPFPAIAMSKFDNPQVEYLKAAWKPKKGAEAWPRAGAWYGLIAENATQATCADLMREALVRAVRDGLPIMGSVHDELIGETTTRGGKKLAKEIERCMLTIPDWAAGLPLAVETDVSPRFRK